LGALFTVASVIAMPFIWISDFLKPVTDFITKNDAVQLTLVILLVVGAIAFLVWLVRWDEKNKAMYEELNRSGNEEQRKRFWEACNMLPAKNGEAFEFEGSFYTKENYMDWLKKDENKLALDEYIKWCAEKRKTSLIRRKRRN
jgi:hypothetical protein